MQYIAATVFPNSKLVQLFADKPTATPPPAEISVLSSKAISRLQERGETIGTCESLTAGLLSAEIAAIPGASQVFRGALVTYATDLKIQLAGVDAAYIAAHGVIDAGTVSQMATGAKQRLGTDWAIALSGVAGPDTQDGHPVGEVWLAIQGPGTTAIVTKLGNPLLSGSREEIRLAAVKLSLEELLKLLG
nr:CinA family protein [Corynebacterium caspium]